MAHAPAEMVLEGLSGGGLRPSVDPRALRIQLAVLGALALAYVALALFWAPPHNRLLLPVGLLAMGAAAAAGARLGPARGAGTELVVVWFVLTMGILIPAVADGPSPRGRGFVTGLLGVFCALGLWAVFRYPARERTRGPRSLAGDLRWGLSWGAGMAALFSLYALVVGGVAALAGQDVAGLGPIVAAYWAGGLVAGVLAGLGRPMGRWPLGSMVVGMPAAGAVYGAVMVAMMLMGEGGEEARSPRFVVWMMTAFCAGAGPLGGLMMRGVGDDLLLTRPAGWPGARSTRA